MCKGYVMNRQRLVMFVVVVVGGWLGVNAGSSPPINPDWLCLQVAEALPDDGIM